MNTPKLTWIRVNRKLRCPQCGHHLLDAKTPMTADQEWAYLQSATPTVIRFGCSIRLPVEGKFLFKEDFQENPPQFLRRWIQGAVGTIYEGPLHNRSDHHDHHLIIEPVVAIRHLP